MSDGLDLVKLQKQADAAADRLRTKFDGMDFSDIPELVALQADYDTAVAGLSPDELVEHEAQLQRTSNFIASCERGEHLRN